MMQQTERDLMIELVYPFLAQICAAAGIQFYQPSEMRWGIRDEASAENLTEEVSGEFIPRQLATLAPCYVQMSALVSF